MPEESHEGEEEDGAGAVHQGQEEHADKQTHGPVKHTYENKSTTFLQKM
jgi:hypothetical protein